MCSGQRRAVCVGDEREEGAHRLRGVEVIAERGVEFVARGTNPRVLFALQAWLGAKEVPETLGARDGLLQRLLRERERLTIVAGDQEIDHRLGAEAGDRLSQREDVALRLRHLRLGPGLDHAVVHPDTGERLAPRGEGLRDLVLVVGEHEVDATGVNRERHAQLALRHRGAFDVPTGTARPPGRVP